MNNKTINQAIETLTISSLRPWEKNARVHSKKQIRQIADSITAFGFTNPVLIDNEHTILAGHGRVEAATGERIRDKVAASKKKGMWMGGSIALGYRIEDKKLLPHPEEVHIVNQVFERYLTIKCVRLLHQQLQREGVRSRTGCILSRGMLYNMLSNPLYIGKVRHKGNLYDGLHEPIIPHSLWEQVQAALKENRRGIKSRTARTDASVLADKLFDVSGERLITVQANKKGRRYRYYISQSLTTMTKDAARSGWRLPAQEIERVVGEAAAAILKEQEVVVHAAKEASVPAAVWAVASGTLQALKPAVAIEKFLQRAELCSDGIRLTLSLNTLFPNHPAPVIITHSVPMLMKRRGVEMRLVIPAQHAVSRVDDTMVRLIARAYRWSEQLLTGKVKTLQEIATRENIAHSSYIGDAMKLAFLAPDIVETIIAGRQPADLTAQKLMRRVALPIEWHKKRDIIGF